MSFYTYTILTGAMTVDGSIKNWIRNSAVPSAAILGEAQDWIYQRLRVRQMMQAATGTLSSGAGTLSLSGLNYRQATLFMFTGTEKSVLTKKTLDAVEGAWQYDGAGARATGKPSQFAADADSLVFDTLAQQAYTYRFRYYGALTALTVTTNETNFLTDVYSSLLRAACMYRAFEWMKDQKEKTYWKGVAEAEVFEANKDSDLELSGVEVVVGIDRGDLQIGPSGGF